MISTYNMKELKVTIPLSFNSNTSISTFPVQSVVKLHSQITCSIKIQTLGITIPIKKSISMTLKECESHAEFYIFFKRSVHIPCSWCKA